MKKRRFKWSIPTFPPSISFLFAPLSLIILPAFRTRLLILSLAIPKPLHDQRVGQSINQSINQSRIIP